MALAINLDRIAVTIASGTSESAAIPLGAKTLVGIAMPAAWDSAVLTFEVTVDGSTFLNLFDVTGTEIEAIADAGQYIQIDPAVFAGINEIKIRSGMAAAPVNQTADRALTLVARPV